MSYYGDGGGDSRQRRERLSILTSRRTGGTVTTDTLEGYCSKAEAARLIGVSPATVTYYRWTSRLRTLKTPLGFLFDVADVERLARERGAVTA
jgi:hypothetical protein